MRMRVRVVGLSSALLAVALLGCAGAGGGGPDRGDSDVLSAEEMEPSAAEDLLAVIQRLRPHWAQARKGLTFRERVPISVIVDGIRQEGSLEVLSRYRAGDVQEVRLVGSGDATTRYGLGMMSGAIVVTLRR